MIYTVILASALNSDNITRVADDAYRTLIALNTVAHRAYLFIGQITAYLAAMYFCARIKYGLSKILCLTLGHIEDK